MQSLKGDKNQLEGDSFFNRKPVEVKQDRGNVVRFGGYGNQSEFVVTYPVHRMVNHIRLSCKGPVLR